MEETMKIKKPKYWLIPVIVGALGIIVTVACLTISNPHLWYFLFDGRGWFVYLAIACLAILLFTLFFGRRKRL